MVSAKKIGFKFVKKFKVIDRAVRKGDLRREFDKLKRQGFPVKITKIKKPTKGVPFPRKFELKARVLDLRTRTHARVMEAKGLRKGGKKK